jgi:SAM-dependent methyltransferase
LGASLIYRSALLYESVMLALYGRHYSARYRVLADLVPPGASVLDVCCGPGVLFDRYLRLKGVEYTGLDMNPGFVARVVRLGGRGQVRDAGDDAPLPRADVVIMQASLYQFLPAVAPVVDRMRRAAGCRVIIAEPIRNLITARVPGLAVVVAHLTDPGHGAQPRRFDEASLDAFFRTIEPSPTRSFLIPGGREKVYILEPRR